MFSPRRPPLAFAVDENVPCETRDGIVLRSDVYRPTAAGRFPVLMSRTPYDKKHPMYTKDATALAAQGYIVVIQDVRGRYRSDGDIRLDLREERTDDRGQRWLRLPSNGRQT